MSAFEFALHARIQHRMKELGTSVDALADATGIPRRTLTRRIAAPARLKCSEAYLVAVALDVSPSWLLTGEDGEAAVAAIRSERAG